MMAIEGCQNKPIDHFGQLKFSFMKHDMQKQREKAQLTDHCITCLEDTVRPMETTIHVVQKTL